jgi:chitinase
MNETALRYRGAAKSVLMSFVLVCLTTAGLLAAEPIIVEAEGGKFSGAVDRHSCWHNVMLTDEPHSTFSGSGVVDTPNKAGSFVEVAYDALWTGPHRVTVRYTHIKPDPRPARLLINGKKGPILEMAQNKALPAFNTDSAVIDIQQGRNLIRIVALNEGGLGNTDYIKVAEVRELSIGTLPRIKVLEAEDGLHEGKIDHHSCWNFIAQTDAEHSGFTGEGYVDTENKFGSYIEVEFNSERAGPYDLAVRYVHGKADVRPAEVKINGAVADPSVDFGTTTHWTAWTSLSIPVEIKAGSNIIRLTALSPEGLVNIDHFCLTPGLSKN